MQNWFCDGPFKVNFGPLCSRRERPSFPGPVIQRAEGGHCQRNDRIGARSGRTLRGLQTAICRQKGAFVDFGQKSARVKSYYEGQVGPNPGMLGSPQLTGASLAWRLAGPTLECVRKGADFLIAEQPRDLGN